MQHHRVARRAWSWLALAALAACSAGKFETLGTVSSEVQPQGPFTCLVARIRIGNLEVVEADGQSIRIDGEVLVRNAVGRLEAAAMDAKSQLPFADWVAFAEAGDTITIGNARSDSDHELRLRITVPRAARSFSLRTDVGQVALDVKAATAVSLGVAAGQASCRADSIEGVLEARVETGEFVGDVTGKIGGCDVNVAVGSVQFGLPSTVRGDFALEVDVGAINGAGKFGLTEKRRLTGATASGDKGGPKFAIHVATGQIELH